MSSEKPKPPRLGSPVAGTRRDQVRPTISAGIATTQAGQRPGGGDVEQRVAVARGRAHADDGAEGAEQDGRRDEVRQAHGGTVVARREVVAELVHAEDGQQRHGERRAGDDPARERHRAIGVEGLRAHEEERAGQERGQHGEAEQRQRQQRPGRLRHVAQRPRLHDDAVALGLQERRVAERLEAAEQHVERAAGVGAQPAAEDDHAAADLALVHLQHVLGRVAQPLLGDEQVLGGQRRGRAPAPAEGPERHVIQRITRDSTRSTTAGTAGQPASGRARRGRPPVGQPRYLRKASVAFVPPKPNALRQRDLDVLLARLVRDVVEVAVGIGRLVVDGRRQHPVVEGQHGGDGLDAARGAEQVPVIDLVDETASRRACSPKTRLMASVSNLSLYGVEVPWALM